MKTVHFHGETLNLSKLIAHYRMMARRCPPHMAKTAAFFRDQVRQAIRAYREQRAEAEQREAA